MNETIENLKSRRSIRKFKDEQISDEDLKTILEAGTYAPTARGMQSPKIVVIQNPAVVSKNNPTQIDFKAPLFKLFLSSALIGFVTFLLALN